MAPRVRRSPRSDRGSSAVRGAAGFPRTRGIAGDRVVALVLAACLLGGCAFRDMTQSESFEAWRPVFDGYSRNAIVAAPTLVGNVICIIPATAFGFGLGVLVYVFSGLDQEAARTASSGGWIGLDCFCGGLTGLVFWPFSYLAEEDPWALGLATTKK